MIKNAAYFLFLLIFFSCTQKTDKKEVIRKISNDNLTVKKVDVIQQSNYYTVITDIENSVSSSKEAWKNSPELGQLHRLMIIDKVSNKFIAKLKARNYANDDKVVAYRFIKMNQSKKFVGYAVILFHEEEQVTLFYEIHPDPYDYYPSGGVKQLINKGLVQEINAIDAEDKKKLTTKK
jgi:CRISPR/Cas system-associated protein endoribonuclease Cas2